MGQEEPRKRVWDTEAERERKRLYRERKRAELEDPTLPTRDIADDPTTSPTRPVDLLLTLPPGTPITDTEEQALRDHFGYGSSERRTTAERQSVAERILAKRPPLLDPLPPDLEAVWGTNERDRRTASYLIDAWGVEEFRTSALHRMSVHQIEADRRKREVQQAYVAAIRSKGA